MHHHRSALLGPGFALGLLALASGAAVFSAPAPTADRGKQVFAQRCASCHGAKGEGTKKYAKPLIGAQSAEQLAQFISRSMPPGRVKKVTGADAKQVAGYIFDAFYSPVAQARNRPARVELSHLTVRQYRNALADLIGGFRPTAKPEERHGLQAQYYKTRRTRDQDLLITRIDPELHFDWALGAPGPGDFELHTFSARWRGTVLAPDSGDYDFIIRTEHSFRLWVNDPRKPLIDAGVKSGSDTEYHGSIRLTGGRPYLLRLEFSKATDGVDDTDKLAKMPIVKASLSLEWKPPKRAAEVIPARCLTPAGDTPELFVSAAPFPPDDRSLGYERGTSMSKEWEEATTEGALETAGYVATHLREISGVGDFVLDRKERLQEFCRKFVERAFRRPLTDEQKQFFVDRQFQKSPDPDLAVKRCVILALKSPRFLYPEIPAAAPDAKAAAVAAAAGPGAAASTEPDAYDVASRLSFGLWDSLPDAELLRAAGAGELASRDQVEKQAERMLNDPRARSKVREFFLQWLKLDQAPELAKDAKKFPGFDAAVAADLRTSLELTLEDAVWNGRSDFRDLLLSDKVFLNGRLAKLYGVNLPADAPFQAVTLDSGQRAGILTHPYVLASFAYMDASSPIHRGVLIVRNMLGRTLQPPPQAFTPLPAEQHPDLTTRQRIMLQTKPAACVGCHGMINPLGFTLEKFDAIGRFRTEENGKPIDDSGSYQPLTGKAARFSGARDLAQYLTSSEEARGAFVEKLFQNLVKQPVRAYGPKELPELETAFAVNGYSIKHQVVESVVAAAIKR